MNMHTSITCRRGDLVVLVIGLLALGVAVSGCQERKKLFDTQSGGDHERHLAKSLFPGQSVTDTISDPEGDHTDWKTVRIRESGDMSVTVSIDNTRSMGGFIAIKDEYGVELDRRPINASDNLYTFDKLPVYQGSYYIQVFADTGASPYTAGVTFDPTNKVADRGPLLELTPDPDTAPRPGRRPKNDTPPRETKVNKPDTKVTKNDTEPPKDEPPKEEPPADSPTDVAVQGSILRVIPRDQGGSEIFIAINSASSGVRKGMVGTILGLNKPFTITYVGGRSVQGVTNAEAEDVQPHKNVVIKVKN